MSQTTQVNAGATLAVTGGGNLAAGSVNNAGTFKLDHATAVFSGTFTNSGAYVSDPSTQTFNTMLTTSTGTIRASAGDIYKVGGDFLSHSTQSTGWDTTAATLEFITGSGNTLEHVLDLTGQNLGRSTGYTNNFAWGTLTIDDGNTLELEDGLSGDPDVALYVADIIGALVNGDGISNIIGNGLDIYYDPSLVANAYLGGRNYALMGGGELIATPEPGTLAVLLPGLAAGIVVRRRRGKAKH